MVSGGDKWTYIKVLLPQDVYVILIAIRRLNGALRFTIRSASHPRCFFCLCGIDFSRVPALGVRAEIMCCCVVWNYRAGIIALVLLETGLLLVLGAKFTYWHLGQIYTAIHFINFLLAPPAIANVVFVFIYKDVKRQFLAFAVSCLCCWIACMSVLLGNISVDEAIVGIDAPESFNMTKPERPDTIPQSQFQSSGIP
jgi:hypothetical protein